MNKILAEIKRAIGNNTYLWHDEHNYKHLCYHKIDLWNCLEQILNAQESEGRLALEKIAVRAKYLLDDTCEENGVYTVDKDDFDELSKALDSLELIEVLTGEGYKVIEGYEAVKDAINNKSSCGCELISSEIDETDNEIAKRVTEEYTD